MFGTPGSIGQSTTRVIYRADIFRSKDQSVPTIPVASRKVLLTGSAGFVGYHICRVLLAKGTMYTVLTG